MLPNDPKALEALTFNKDPSLLTDSEIDLIVSRLEESAKEFALEETKPKAAKKVAANPNLTLDDLDV